jgi:hypothetical protein
VVHVLRIFFAEGTLIKNSNNNELLIKNIVTVKGRRNTILGLHKCVGH